MSNLNSNLHQAKANKQDEFYTQLSDIERELKHYKHHFKDKVVYCNADDPRVSNFFHYFSYNFEHLGLKKLITTCYKSQQRDLFSQNDSERAIYLEYTGETDGGRVPTVENIGIHYLQGDGDFKSPEAIELLKQADIVVTNPPFSLFGEYIHQLITYNKHFIVLGNQNTLTTSALFPLFKSGKIWAGVYNGNMEFRVPNKEEYRRDGNRFWIDDKGDYWRSLGNICWFTNLDHFKRHEEVILYKKYSPTEYPKYDNYNAINVDKIADIPCDYEGVMGVPVTFIYKYNPDQFDIIGQTHSGDNNPEVEALRTSKTNRHRGLIDGQQKYARILIKNKKVVK